MMADIYNAYIKIDNKKHLSEGEIGRLYEDDAVKDYQLLSLLAEIRLDNKVPIAANNFTDKQKHTSIKNYLDCLESILNQTEAGNIPQAQYDLLYDIYWKKEIGNQRLKHFVDQVSAKEIDENFLSLLLVLIKHSGMSEGDTSLLTVLMANSGRIYDYRENKALEYRKIIRRYPTGALSEKIALLMPALLMEFSQDYAICSPFLVARSLSFTGGTWDKLKSIEGFTFPKQGSETIEILKECKVSMTVTEGDFNPADRFLYQFRSITNTVRSKELIISSIGSKQLAVPADSLLLDMRLGEGAFLNSQEDVDYVGQKLEEILKTQNIKTEAIITEANEPTGSCIGNYWEVLEALAIMSNSTSVFGHEFNPVGLKIQLELLYTMTAKLLCMEFPHLNQDTIRERAKFYLQGGTVLESFLRLLKAHGVKDDIVNSIRRGKSWIDTPMAENAIIASQSGYLNRVRQQMLGSFVNFTLRNGHNEITTKANPFSGVILYKRIGEKVNKGDILAKVMHTEPLEAEVLEDRKYFEIKTT